MADTDANLNAYTLALSKVCEGRLAIACPRAGPNGPEVRVIWSSILSAKERKWARARTPWFRAVTLTSFAVERMNAIRAREETS